MSARVSFESAECADVEAQLLPQASEEMSGEPSFDKQRASLNLCLENKEQYEKYYIFLIEQTVRLSIFLSMAPLQILFTVYLVRLFTNGAVSRPGGMLILIGRLIRVLSCCFGWLHLYFLNSVKAVSPETNKWAVLCADQLIFWTSVSGSLIILVRVLNGSCGEDAPESVCNPRHEENGVPLDTLGGNLFMIIVLPLIFKAHQTKYLCLSYFIAFVGMVAAAVIAKATADTLTIIALCIAIGTLIYDNKRNMMTMFIVLQGQWSYYNSMLTIERNKANAEMESVELRKLIGSVAHDLKTPLQAIMVELDGLQSEVNVVRQQIIGLTDINSPPVSKHSNEISAHTDEVQKHIESLKDVYHFMMMTINRAIEYRKMASGIQLMSTKETFHLGKAVDWVVARFSNNPSGVPIRVENKLDENCCPYLITDKHWFTESLLTLLSNACKFTTKGEIVVRLDIVSEMNCNMRTALSNSNEQSDSITLTAFKEDHSSMFEHVGWSGTDEDPYGKYFVLIEVEDSGIGVSASQVKHLFKPFGKTQRRVGGTGLGLHSLYTRVKELNGRCGFRQRDSGSPGCSFWFLIPYCPDSVTWQEINKGIGRRGMSTAQSQSERIPQSERESVERLRSRSSDNKDFGPEVRHCFTPRQKRNKVLVVDDSTLILKTTSRMLRKEGFVVETAQNGEDALNMMLSDEYLFILSDIQMPVMDGLEMAKRIREVERTTYSYSKLNRHIIGMSANSDTQTRDDSLNCGMNAFLPKPVRMNDLSVLISALEVAE